MVIKIKYDPKKAWKADAHKNISFSDTLDEIETHLAHIPKFIRRDVAEAVYNKTIQRSVHSDTEFKNRIKILEESSHPDTVNNGQSIRIILVELLLQDMKIKSLESRIRNLELKDALL